MHTRAKLAILELIEGLFGWVWIIASAAFLFYLGKRFFFEGTWAPVIWALCISVVAKWLAIGFRDNKARVSYESKLVEQGVAPNDAAQAWSAAYNGGPDLLAEISRNGTKGENKES